MPRLEKDLYKLNRINAAKERLVDLAQEIE